MFLQCKCPIKEYWLGLRRCVCTLCGTSVNNQCFIYKSPPFPSLWSINVGKELHTSSFVIFISGTAIFYQSKQTHILLILSHLCAFEVGRTLIWEADWLTILQEMPLSIVLSLLGCFVQGFLQTPPIWTKPILAKQTELEDEKEYLASTLQTAKR